jgi:hypothetical protein
MRFATVFNKYALVPILTPHYILTQPLDLQELASKISSWTECGFSLKGIHPVVFEGQNRFVVAWEHSSNTVPEKLRTYIGVTYEELQKAVSKHLSVSAL